MERTLIAPGVHLSCDPAEKFNRCRISIHFAFPAQRATATAHALLPLVLERGYADCPDMTLLTKKLAKLYGADLTVDARPMGCNHNLCVSVTGIKDRFALEGEPLTREYASIALGAAFHPAFVGGVFDPQAVEIEKQMLKKALEDEVNDKRIYCLRQANREFFGDSPAAVRQEGYLEEVDGLTPEQLTAAYREMLRTASIELIVLGCDDAQTAAIRDALRTELTAIDDHRTVMVEELNILRERTGRHIALRGFRLDRYCRDFRLTGPAAGYEIAFGLFDVCFSGSDTRCLCRFLRFLLQTHFLHLTVGNRHHCFIETVDGRIVIPIKRAVKFQFLFSLRSEFFNGNVFDPGTWLRFGSIFSRFGLTAGFAYRLQFPEQIVGEKTRIGIVGIIRTAVSLYLFGRFRLRLNLWSSHCRRCQLWRLHGL